MLRKFGAVAQLGERVVRNDEVAGSNPVCSTNGDKGLFHYNSLVSTPQENMRQKALLFIQSIITLLYGISIIPYNWVGSEGAVTATNKWQCLAEAAS